MAGSDLRALAADLAGAGQKVRTEASTVVRRSGLAVQNHARSIAPVDTGAHRANIHRTSSGDGLTDTVTAGQDYASFLEHGTVFMAAQPAMGPALEAVEPSFIAAMEQVGGRHPVT